MNDNVINFSNEKILIMLEKVLQKLREKGLKITTAESCTGGLVAASITEIAGCSDVFDRGFVTYSNDSKIKQLGVNSITLEKFGAVSGQIALEMGNGAIKNSSADIAVSITGIAGPDGGTPEKPVGLVFIGIVFSEKAQKLGLKNNVIQMNLEGTRSQIRRATVNIVFAELNNITLAIAA
jgi:PncC family amidohydrolase